MGAFDDLIPGYFQPDLAQGRSRFADELANPNIRLAFNQRVANEVGGQSEDEQQAFIESVMNRANARKQRLSDVVNDRSYFPSQSFRNAGDVDYSPFIQKAIQGSNVSRRATGNESANVHSGGAPVTMAGQGGERFVVENKDTAFPFQDLIPGKQTAGAFDDLIPKKDAASAVAQPQPAQQQNGIRPKSPMTDSGWSYDETSGKWVPTGELYGDAKATVAAAEPQIKAAAQAPTYAPQVVTPDQPVSLADQIRDYFDLQKQAQAPEQRSAGAKTLTAAGEILNQFVPHSTPLATPEGIKQAYANMQAQRAGQPIPYPEQLKPTGGIASLATPVVSSIEELANLPESLPKDYANVQAELTQPQPPIHWGPGIQPPANVPYPEQLGPLYAAERTAPFSQERFTAGGSTVAQEIMAALLGPHVMPQGVGPTITPGRTMADLEAAARAEPAGPQPEVKPGTIAEDVSRALKPEPVTTGDVTRAILDKRNDLVAEAQQLQQQADISRAATGQVHPAVEQRIAEINQQLNQPEQEPNLAQKIAALRAEPPQLEVQGPEPAAKPAAAPPAGMGDTAIDARRQAIDKEIAAYDDMADKVGGIENLPDEHYQRRSALETEDFGLEVQKKINRISSLTDSELLSTLDNEFSKPHTPATDNYIRQLAAEISKLGLWERYAKKYPESASIILEEAKPAAAELPTSPAATKAAPTEAAKPPVQGPAPPASDEPHISGIANRFVEERAARGEVGEIAPGQGHATVDLVQRGLKMPPERAAEAVSRMMQGGDVPIDDAAAIRGEEARLSQRSNQMSRIAQGDPANVEARLAADNAFKDLTDFHNGPIAQLKRNWHAQGMSMQGEVPVDLSTLNGLREAWLRDTGKPPPPAAEPMLRRTADKVARGVAEENGARAKLSGEIEKATRTRKLPTADEVRQNIAERMKVEPCII